MISLVPYRRDLAPALLAIWQAAMGARFPIMPALWAANTDGDPDFRPEDGLVAVSGAEAVGFALAKRYRGDFPGCERDRALGQIALIAVHPGYQRRGVGTALLAAAEGQLAAEGVTKLIAGGGYHHFMPGVLEGCEAAGAFFAARGYLMGRTYWDVRRDLSTGPALPEVDGAIAAAGVEIRPFAPGEEAVLAGFFETTFRGRWGRDVQFYLERGCPIEHVMGVFADGRARGFAQLHAPGAAGAARWSGFNPRIAALGPIGVDAALRGKGLGLALLVRGLERLRALGATDTVIDWTDLLDFYAHAGFQPWLGYHTASKAV